MSDTTDAEREGAAAQHCRRTAALSDASQRTWLGYCAAHRDATWNGFTEWVLGVAFAEIDALQSEVAALRRRLDEVEADGK